MIGEPLAHALAALAIEAGAAILAVRASAADPSWKSDGSPLTAADLAAEAVIDAGLKRLLPGVPVISEEADAATRATFAAEARFILVDPLDGTKEFISGRDEFTVNIAIVEQRRPIFGVVYAPALQALYLGHGDKAFAAKAAPGHPFDPISLAPIKARRAGASLSAVASRSHADAETEAFLAALPIADRVSIGSSLKFCLVAEGKADLYPRFGPTMEWDTAAGDAVASAAGASVTNPDGTPFLYGKREAEFRNGSFVVRGRAA
jgi:3'(2'), 5'-bisphosphate nucleotidase